MYNDCNLSLEKKRKLDKMNMVLNNLEQKLGGNEELCQGIAKIIDMTIENNELVARLEEIDNTQFSIVFFPLVSNHLDLRCFFFLVKLKWKIILINSNWIKFKIQYYVNLIVYFKLMLITKNVC